MKSAGVSLGSCLAAVAIATAFFPNSVGAGPLNTFPNLVEVMMEAQSADATHIGALLGADGTSPLVYAATLDANLLTFSYSLAPGSMYLGLPITQVTTGAYNPASMLWDITSTGSYDSLSWSGIGGGQITGDPVFDFPITFGAYTVMLHAEWNYPPTGTGLATSTAGITVTKAGSLVGTLNTADESEVIAGVFGPFTITTTNTLFAPGGGGPFKIKIEGDPIAPGGGGPVGITQTITSVPEPASGALSAIGILLIGLGRRHLAARV